MLLPQRGMPRLFCCNVTFSYTMVIGLWVAFFFLLKTKVLSEVQERFPDAKSLKRQVGAYDVPPDRSLCPTTT